MYELHPDVESSGDDSQALDAVWEIVITVLGSVSAGIIMLMITKRYHDRRHPDDSAPPPPPSEAVSTFSQGSNGANGNGSIGNGSIGNGSIGNGSIGNGSVGNGGGVPLADKRRAVV